MYKFEYQAGHCDCRRNQGWCLHAWQALIAASKAASHVKVVRHQGTDRTMSIATLRDFLGYLAPRNRLRKWVITVDEQQVGVYVVDEIRTEQKVLLEIIDPPTFDTDTLVVPSYVRHQIAQSDYLTSGEVETLAWSDEQELWELALQHPAASRRLLWQIYIENEGVKQLRAQQVLKRRWPNTPLPDPEWDDAELFERRLEEDDEAEAS